MPKFPPLRFRANPFLKSLLVALVAGMLTPIAGCSPPPPTAAELGRIVFSADDMPGGHKRFLLPEIKGQSNPAGEPQGEHDHAGHAPHEDHPPAEGPGADK